MNDLVEAKNVADRFGVKVATVHTWRRRGLIPCVKPTQGTIRFRMSEVERAVERMAGSPLGIKRAHVPYPSSEFWVLDVQETDRLIASCFVVAAPDGSHLFKTEDRGLAESVREACEGAYQLGQAADADGGGQRA